MSIKSKIQRLSLLAARGETVVRLANPGTDIPSQ